MRSNQVHICSVPLAQAASTSLSQGAVPEPEQGKPFFCLAEALDLRRVHFIHKDLKGCGKSRVESRSCTSAIPQAPKQRNKIIVRRYYLMIFIFDKIYVHPRFSGNYFNLF